MNKKRKELIGVVMSLIIVCCLIPVILTKLGSSPGLPTGNCAVDHLLLDLSAFPADTTVSSGADFEDLATISASHTFINLPENIEVYQSVEYYNTPLLAWTVYAYNRGAFIQNQHNGPWTKPSAITFSSQIAEQYYFACSTNTNFGYRCMLIARYVRYLVFLRANLSDSFTVQDIGPLLQKIDSRILPCINK